MNEEYMRIGSNKLWHPVYMCFILHALACQTETEPTNDPTVPYALRSTPTVGDALNRKFDTVVIVSSESSDPLSKALSDAFNTHSILSGSQYECSTTTLLLYLLKPQDEVLLPQNCQSPRVFIPIGNWTVKEIEKMALLGGSVLSPTAELMRYVDIQHSTNTSLLVASLLYRLQWEYTIPNPSYPEVSDIPPFGVLAGQSPSEDVRDQFYAAGDSEAEEMLLRLSAAKNGSPLWDDSDPWVQARGLMNTRDPVHLCQAIQSGSSLVRLASVQQMVNLSHETPTPALEGCLTTAAGQSDSYMRWKAAYGLRFYPSSVPLLINLLMDPDIDVQRESANSLGFIGGAESKDALIRASNSTNSFVRRWATAALSELNDPTLKELLNSKREDPVLLVAIEAQRGLERLGEPTNFKKYTPPPPPQSPEELSALLVDPDATVRKDAIKYLLGSSQLHPLIPDLLKDSDSEVRKLAVTSLHWVSDSQPHLLEATKDTDPDVVIAALIGLSKQPLVDSTPLLRFGSYSDTEHRLRGIEAIIAANDDVANLWLPRWRLDPDERIRAAIVTSRPDLLNDSEPSEFVKCQLVSSSPLNGEQPTFVQGCQNGADPDLKAFVQGVIEAEDDFLHVLFSWNHPSERPPSHQSLRPPLFRKYGFPDRG
jgi:HEAT repeat protein